MELKKTQEMEKGGLRLTSKMGHKKKSSSDKLTKGHNQLEEYLVRLVLWTGLHSQVEIVFSKLKLFYWEILASENLV